MPNEAVIIAISTFLGALLGIIPGVYAIIAQRRERKAASLKHEVETRRLEDEITARVLERAKDEIAELTEENMTLSKEIRDLKAEVEVLRKLVNRLKTGVRQLCVQIEELGHDPVFDLDEEVDGKS